MEATPRPWEVDADFDYELCFTEGGEAMSGWQIYGPKSWPVAAVWVEGIVDRPTGRANAELIVRAVNSHDRLVEALEALVGEIESSDTEWGISSSLLVGAYLTRDQLAEARAALALARGEVVA